MSRQIIIENDRITLSASQLIQSGGEGLVFMWGNKAVKLYHQSRKLHQDKLTDWDRHGYRMMLPANVLGPEKLAYDEDGTVIGYLMNRLPEDSKPLKQLSGIGAWKNHLLKKRDVTAVFIDTHATLTSLHQMGLIVGDLNDQNIYSPLPRRSESASRLGIHWIDVDSFQFNGHPCPVAMQAFLDPTLYGTQDFSLQPCFSRDSDWYAFQVMLLKTLLLVHPYGGSHHQQKSIQARASARTSIFNSSVTYPQLAHPKESLTDEMLHHFFQVFEEGRRLPFPVRLLHNYRSSLTECARCGFQFPTSRKRCPMCSQQRRTIERSEAIHDAAIRCLLVADNLIDAVHVANNGQISAVLKDKDQYELVRMDASGSRQRIKLFSGTDSYRFAWFGDNLVVNNILGTQLLLLDISQQTVRQTTLIDTASFKGTAVFATSADHLFRIAGGWLMRGTVRDGKFIEDAISTVHKQQTQLFASAQTDMVGGIHRVFSEYEFFMISARGVHTKLAVPPLQLGESGKDTIMRFSRRSAAVLRHVISDGRGRVDINEFDFQGQLKHSCSLAVESENKLEQIFGCYPYTTQSELPSPPFISVPREVEQSWGQILTHPYGLVIHNSRQLSFIPYK